MPADNSRDRRKDPLAELPAEAGSRAEPLRGTDRDLAPPEGDHLRAEATFGRTDRYSTMDDADASRQQSVEELDDRGADSTEMEDRRREPPAD